MIPRASNYWICAVCARSGCGAGYSKPRPFRPLWVCDDPECLQIARSTYTMRQDKFDHVEALAAEDGGDAFGGYCDAIGKTDLATMTEAEFREAFQTGIAAYRNALKARMYEAPF